MRQIDLNVKLINKQSFKDIRGVKTEKIEKIESFNIKAKHNENNEKRENYFNNNIIIKRNERYRYLQHIADKLRKKKCFKCL